ncbi:MAG: hypothetical protein E7448_08750 [Ruminococcaceae bacterium]|nr:hypothetical protein [Oscillospiraceae bacterium]
MIRSQVERLANKTGEYLSIGITQGGEPRSSFSVPWVSTAHAFNMRTPDVFLAPEDLLDEQIMAVVGTFKVNGCYIYAPMEHYDFLTQFKDLQDLTIVNGDAIRNLDFLEALTDCRMLYLQNAQLPNLNIIADMKKRSKPMSLILQCIGLDNCTVEDLSIFETADVHFSEFLIWNPTSRNERERWASVSASTKRYYEFKE